MASDCSHIRARYACGPHARRSPHFEVIDGLLYRKKLERGYINYREVLREDRRHEAISTFHQRRPGQRHLSLEETYKCVAENYWWEGMYFQIRDVVLSCSWCQKRRSKKLEDPEGRGCVTKTITTHGADVLSKLRSQREAGLFCDITLRTSGRSFSAHRAVLAAVSDHFHEIFTDVDSSKRADVDLTGFSEDSLLSLLDFSYSSTLCVRLEDLPEVCAMARHLGMWPAVEACSALLKEQEQRLHPLKAFPSACAGACREHRRQQREELLGFNNVNNSFSLTLEASGGSLQGSPRRNLRRTPKSQGHNGLPMSPSHRMKLMDFKSPSSKKPAAPRHAIPTSQSTGYPPISQPNTRLLRSSPGAAKEVQRLLPMAETPRRSRKSNCVVSRFRTSGACSPVRVKQEVEEVGEDEEDFARAQEKYKLMNVLGLQRTALLPRPEDLIGWRQKKRLRKLKVNNYSLTKRRKPRSTSPGLSYGDMTLSLPLCSPVTTRLISKSGKTKPAGSVGATKQKRVERHVPPSDRSMRSKGVLPDLFLHASYGGRELRRSVRKADDVRLHSHPPPRRRSSNKRRNAVRIKAEPDECSISGLKLLTSDNLGEHALSRVAGRTRTPAKDKLGRGGPAKEADEMRCKSREEERKVGSHGSKTSPTGKHSEPNGLQFPEHELPSSIYQHPLYKAIKEEPAEPVPVGAFPDPPSPDLGKRQSKPPIKLLDSGFLFSFCRPPGGPMAVLKKEEESVDICLTRSVSRVGEKFESEESPQRTLRARGTPVGTVVKRERTERSVTEPKRRRATSRNATPEPTRCARSKTTRTTPKTNNKQQNKLKDASSRSCAVTDAVRRARLKRLRGPRSQVPKVPKAAHACLQCSAVYKDCDALIMHRLRHVEGKHWPCPLCSKTFFRLRNVRNHIRTHDPKLYKCRSCIVAGS